MPALGLIVSYLALLLAVRAFGDYMEDYRWFMYPWILINICIGGYIAYLIFTHPEVHTKDPHRSKGREE